MAGVGMGWADTVSSFSVSKFIYLLKLCNRQQQQQQKMTKTQEIDSTQKTMRKKLTLGQKEVTVKSKK